MKNLLISILFIVLTVGFGCKNMFQEKSVVGQWKEIRTYRPSQGKWQTADKSDDFIEFFSNGEIGVRIIGNYNVCCRYTLDNKANPKRIIATNKSDNKQQTWIFKVEGKKMTIKIPSGDNQRTAANFDPEPDFEIIEYEKQ